MLQHRAVYEFALWTLTAVIGLQFACAQQPKLRKPTLGQIGCVNRLILQVNVKDAVQAETDKTITQLLQALKTARLSYSQVLEPDPQRHELIEVNGTPAARVNDVRALFNAEFSTQYDIRGARLANSWILTMKPLVEKSLEEKTLRETIEIIRSRMVAFGVKGYVVQRYRPGTNQILVEPPSTSNISYIKRAIGSTTRLEIHAVENDPSGYPDESSALAALGGTLPLDKEIVHGSDTVFILQRIAIVTSSDFRSVDSAVNQNTGHPTVNFTLTNDAGDRFYDFTSANIGKSMAIVMGGRIREVAIIKSAIRDSGQIEGAFTQEEGTDFSRLLRTGALPASFDFIEDRAVCSSSSSPRPTQ
jgi:preprotein translocase subunit SecD